MSTLRENKLYRELKTSFESNNIFTHVHSYDLYRNWLEAVWLFCDAVNDRAAFKERLDKYTFEQGKEFARLMTVYAEAVEQHPFRDILGELFMELDVKSARAGQYFTPGEIAEFMARMLFSKDDFERTVKEKGEVSVCDPAVGSGVMLLAFAKVVHEELGCWGVSKLRLYGTDIDERCVLMCRIQLRMNGLDSFGRMAGLFGAMATVEAHTTSHRQLPATLPDEAQESICTQELRNTPDLTQAVILHTEERHIENEELAEQLVLF